MIDPRFTDPEVYQTEPPSSAIKWIFAGWLFLMFTGAVVAAWTVM